MKLFMTRVLAHRVVGRVEHDEQLHQLRGLQVAKTGRASQRRLPFTSRPMPGISTSTSSPTPTTNSHGAACCHSAHGT